MRKSLVVISASLLLFGCGQPFERRVYNDVGVAHMLVRPPAVAAPSNDNALFSYMHDLVLEMPRAGVEPRYERARERCLHDAALNCKLVSSSLSKQDGPYAGYSAQLTVALPHDKVAAYEKDLVAPVAGEKPGDAAITSRSTTAQNVTQEATSAGRKVAQLTDYRDRLQGLLKKSGLSVDDLIKVESELSKTQNDLDDALSQKSDVDDRLAREQLSISLSEKAVPEGAFAPVTDVWKNAVDILGESTATALRFLIGLVPWLPLIAAGIFLLRWFWRIARRRPSDARSGPE
ncbi:MAG TPA: DUF4349 domain-containing protein [Bradyrhizobium sp.]|nr:DUF4349 domain-containing protein [Bradyrhizobium sp.]